MKIGIEWQLLSNQPKDGALTAQLIVNSCPTKVFVRGFVSHTGDIQDYGVFIVKGKFPIWQKATEKHVFSSQIPHTKEVTQTAALGLLEKRTAFVTMPSFAYLYSHTIANGNVYRIWFDRDRTEYQMQVLSNNVYRLINQQGVIVSAFQDKTELVLRGLLLRQHLGLFTVQDAEDRKLLVV